MPKIYRGMKQEQGKPMIGPTGTTLGARVPRDIEADANGLVHAGTGGMSVSPTLRTLPYFCVPERLQTIYPRARGSDDLAVWSMGTGDFAEGVVTEDLNLRPDPANTKHGLVEPASSMTLDDYQNALAATQEAWVLDEK